MTGAQRLRQEGLDKGRKQGLHRGRKQGLDKGRKQGLHRGRKQGLHRGHRLLLLRQLETRFGALPAAVVEQVNAGSIEELDAWAVRVLTAAKLEDVFA